MHGFACGDVLPEFSGASDMLELSQHIYGPTTTVESKIGVTPSGLLPVSDRARAAIFRGRRF